MLARPDGHLCPHALELLHLRFRHQHVVPESPLYGWDWEWDRMGSIKMQRKLQGKLKQHRSERLIELQEQCK
ncbi:Os03g0384900 [Oryza sativa Japonica Group]|uniref:Uncharacterized protein n=3 Tax=Oryza TaxID=4527 RepID=Q10KG9_ORYSJ|nr:hypothetical protein LOC_Os03g26770 [Oryza sativa Japonica Group]BAF12164.1 Os03g0384900 [Oryza sativa Japonica Group]|eukprot:NP_001050250.1 Os03g0384900 [Oryza sativa Japonica Group]